MTDKIEPVEDILKRCESHIGYVSEPVETTLLLCINMLQMVLDEPQNLVWITREEMKEFSDLHQASLDVELAKQEQREKDEQICEQISNKYAERSTSPLSRHNAKAKAAHLCAMKIRNGG